jgi:lipopolysaccharide assembly outer membrane protein LptD (OstA)
MKNIYSLIFGLSLLLISGNVFAQDLDVLLNAETKPTINYATATFKASRIINGHSIQQMKKKQLDFRISHRFGTLNEGAYGLFGLDHSNIHFSLEYGVTDWLMLGVGRGSLNKIYDGFAKFKLLRQSTGAKTMPISMSYLTTMEINSMKFADTTVPNYFSSRLTFVNQILIARKFNDKFSFQLSPSWVHRNLVPTELDLNDIFSMGMGARYKLTKRMSVNAEYFYNLNPNAKYLEPRTYNSASIGIDIETGGHVFQIMLSNSIGMREGTFIPKTTDNWLDGGIHLGFNISRVFAL